MAQTINISIFVDRTGSGRGIPVQLEEQLLAKYPCFVTKQGKLDIDRRPADDPSIRDFLSDLEAAGVDLFAQYSSASPLILRIKRNYPEEDLTDVRFYHNCFSPDHYLGEVDYPFAPDADGVPALSGKPQQKKRLFGTPCDVLPISFFVSRGEAKERIEQYGFKGLKWKLPQVNRAREIPPEEQLWALWSSIVLPPMKNLCAGNPGYFRYADLPQDVRESSPSEGSIINPELHYRRDAIEALGDFDVAVMAESFAIHGTPSRRLVFSRRFRDFVLHELRLPFWGVPVHLDDDDEIPWAGPYPEPWAHLKRRPAWLQEMG